MKHEPSVLFKLRALRLLAPELSGMDHLNSTNEAAWLKHAVMERGEIDEVRLAEKMVQMLVRSKEDPLSGMFELAEKLVIFRDGTPRCADSELWHRIGFEIDTDLIMAARLAMLRSEPLPKNAPAALAWPSVLAKEDLLTDSVQLKQMVDTHVHLGGALPGSFYWIAIMANYTPLKRLQNWDVDTAKWTQRITRAISDRKTLFEKLFQLQPESLARNTDHHYYHEKLPPEPFVDYALKMLIPDKKLRLKFNPVLGERYLLWGALSRIWRNFNGDPDFKEVFLDYIRCRNSFIREMAHQPGYRGLTRFQRTFKKQRIIYPDRGKFRERKRRRAQRALLSLEQFRVRHALRYQFSDPTDAPWARDHGTGFSEDNQSKATPWRPARQVELRVSPISNKIQMRVINAYLKGIADFVREDHDAPLVRVGLIFHVLKRASNIKDLLSMHQQAKWSLKGLVSILDTVPALRPFIVGIDAAGAEQNISPRNLAPFFNMLLEKGSQDLGSRAQSPGSLFQTSPGFGGKLIPGAPPIRLRRTIHCGEDFPDQLTGLRWMDDAVRLLKLRPGERMGHGLALAWEPEDWYQTHYPVLKPWREHVLDLIWCCAQSNLNDRAMHLAMDRDLYNQAVHYLEHFLANSELTQSTFGTDLSEVIASYDLGLDHELLAGMNLPDLGEFVEVDADSVYQQFVGKMRERVRRRLSKSDIIIEACPTSNLLIGKFKGYANLPYLNLNRTGLKNEQTIEYPIMLSINTDNPGNFKTTIANEFRLMGGALLEQGYGTREAVRWLNEVREVGLAGTFIPPWSPPTKAELTKAIEYINNPLNLRNLRR